MEDKSTMELVYTLYYTGTNIGRLKGIKGTYGWTVEQCEEAEREISVAKELMTEIKRRIVGEQ